MKLNNTLTFFTLLLTISSAYQAQASQLPQPLSQKEFCFFDDFEFCWQLKFVFSNETADYYSGTMISHAGESGAAAIVLKPYDGRISISTDYRHGRTPFHYDLKWEPISPTPSANGAWANSNGVGQGIVDEFISIPCPCEPVPNTSSIDATPRPGE